MDWADRIGRRIRLRDLHVLLAVAECGSMAKAAGRLSISHPVVSQTISELEKTLGVRLFDRNSQGVAPTAFGRALLKSGTIVFDEMRQGLKQIEFLARPDAGEVRIGCPEIVITGILPTIVEHFSRKYPNVVLHVVHENTALRQFHELRVRNVELVFGRAPRPFLEEDLVAETLFDEPFVAVAGAENPLSRRRRMTLADLAGECWVLPPYDSVPGAMIADIFRGSDMQPVHARVVTLSVQLTITLIATGRFVGVLPKSVALFSARRSRLKVLPIEIPPQQFGAHVITVRNRTLSPLAELFIKCTREVLRPLQSS